MAEQDKGKFSTSIGQDVIDEALRSVDKRQPGGEVDGNLEADAASNGEAAGDAAAETTADAPADRDSPDRKELEQLRAQLEFSQAKGRELMEKFKAEHERMLRATADLENYRKRALKEKEEIQRFGIEKLLKDFLPVADNLERALEHARSPADFDSLVQGIRMTRKLFEDALGKHGVKGFSAKGQPFDPRVHEAMQQVETGDMPANHVYAEVLRGYTLNDRLMRPALVMVSKAPAPVPEKVAEAMTDETAEGAAGGGEAAGGTNGEAMKDSQAAGAGGGGETGGES